MTKENKSNSLRINIGASIITVLCFVIYTVMIKTVDVRAVGEAGSVVGFAGVNEIFYNMLPFNDVLYKISEMLGYITFLLVACFALLGAMQLFKGKSLKAVDPKIYTIGGFYVAMAVVYVLFEKVIINYRPVIVDIEEGLEASYPSSHTVLAICICMSAIIMFPYYIKNKKICIGATVGTVVVMLGVVVTRFLSGAHWLTDIVGGMLVSAALVSIFVTVINIVNKRTKSHI